MSYKSWKRIDLWEWTKTGVFSEWYVDNTPNLYIPQWASPYLRNARLDGNTVHIRNWHRLFKTLDSRGYWIWTYLKSNESDDRLIVRENILDSEWAEDPNKKLALYDDEWHKTEINTATNITSNKRMDFVNVADAVFCMNWVDKFWKLSWTTYSIPSNVPANFSPRFWVVFNGCLWVSWWSNNPNVVYKSLGWLYNSSWAFQTPAYDNFTATWSDQFTFQENITWLCANAQALFYFTKGSVSVTWQNDIETVQISSSGGSRVAYTTSVLTAKEWAVNHESIVWVGNDVYYITPNNKICKIVRGNNIYWYEVMELSGRKYAGCEWLMKSLAKDQTQCWWYYVPWEDIIKWFFRSEWSWVNDVCVVYDVEKDKFLVDNGKIFYWWVAFHNKVYALAEVEPKLYEDEIGTEDEDAPIPFEYWTKQFYIWEPTYKKLFWETRTTVDINQNSALTQEIWIDGKQVDSTVIDKSYLPDPNVWGIGTFATATSMVWVDIEADQFTEWLDYSELYVMRTKGNLNQRWHWIQFRFSNSAEGSKVRLKYLSIKVEILPELTSPLK